MQTNSGLEITTVGFGAWAIADGGWPFGGRPQDDKAAPLVLKRHQQFKHTTPLCLLFRDEPLHFAEFIGAENMTALAQRLPLFNDESCKLQLTKETFHGYSST